MKIYISFFAILFITVAALAQINNLPIPKEAYSKDSKKLVKISNLMNDPERRLKTFSGKVSVLRWETDEFGVFFRLGDKTFHLDYSNLSDAGRSQIKNLVKDGNKLTVSAYDNGKNGAWLTREIIRK